MLGTSPYNPGLDFSLVREGNAVVGAAGGTAILVHKSVAHQAIDLVTDLHATAVSVVFDQRVTVCSVYLDPSFSDRRGRPLSLRDLQSLVDQLPAPYLLLGDFNAKSVGWGSNTTNDWGSLVEDLVESHDLVLLNNPPDSPTRYDLVHNSSSVIDLSFCSPSLALDFMWSVGTELWGSDHFPITLVPVCPLPTAAPPRWKLDQAKWADFKKAAEITESLGDFPCHVTAYDSLVEKIVSAAEEFIPRTGGKPRRPVVPWWDKECGVRRKVTRTTFRRYCLNKSVINKIVYKRARAKQKRYFGQAKKSSWIHYVNGINSQTPSRYVWSKLKKLAGKFAPTPPISLLKDGVLLTEPIVVAGDLATHFASVSSATNYTLDFQAIRGASHLVVNPSDDSEHYNMPFSYRELQDALSRCNDTSPGEDTITYSMLRHLPSSALHLMLDVFSSVFRSGVLPDSWLRSTIIPFRKPGKAGTLPIHYRPIALTSCVCKLFEKMVNSRLVWFLEKEHVISDWQFGFRRNRSTLDPLSYFSRHVQEALDSRRQTIGVFFDLAKAYDTAWRQGILQQLADWGLRGSMFKFIQSFLSNRLLRVRAGTTLSSYVEQEEGVPQGSVLSVTLFLAAINGILAEIPPGVHGSLFVDDLVIYCSGTTAAEVAGRVNRAIEAVSGWAGSRGFRFSAEKTKAVRFTRSHRMEEVPTLMLSGSIIPYEEQVKFLGVTFDRGFNFNAHVTSLVAKVKCSFNLLRVVSSFDWGADRELLLRMYACLCRSKIDYACQIYSSACRTTLAKLDVVHNAGVRICTGAFRTSPVESLLVEAAEPPLSFRREELGLRYVTRVRSAPSNPNYSGITKTPIPDRFTAVRSSRPLEVRLTNSIESLGLRDQTVLEVKQVDHPPWITPRIHVCTLGITKGSCPPEGLRGVFEQHCADQHANCERLFTDGSKSAAGVGAAVSYKDEDALATINPVASVFTAELLGITGALSIIHESPHPGPFVIHSDSKSSLTAISSQYNPRDPLVRAVLDWLFLLHSRRKAVVFCWVPAHVGIPLNEQADKAAGLAARSRPINRKAVPVPDWKGAIHYHVKNKWQSAWQALPTNQKLKAIKPQLGKFSIVGGGTRRSQIVLARLRIGHTHLTHSFLLRSEAERIVPECQQCRVNLTVQHILIECPCFAGERRRFGMRGLSLQSILIDNLKVNHLVDFLKAIGVYYRL